MAKHQNQTKSKRSSRNVSRKGSRMPSIAKSRKSAKRTPMKHQKQKQDNTNSNKQPKELEQVYFTVEQDLKILDILQQTEGKARTPKKTKKIKKSEGNKQTTTHSLVQAKKNALKNLSKELNIKYQKILTRSNMLSMITNKTQKQLENVPSVYQKEEQKYKNLIELKTQKDLQIVDNFYKKEYTNQSNINGMETKNKFTVEQDIDIYKMFQQIDGQQNKRVKERLRRFAARMNKKTIYLTNRYKLLSKLPKSDLDTIEMEKDSHPNYYAHIVKSNDILFMDVIQKEELKNHCKKKLEEYEDQLLKDRLETCPDLEDMAISSGKNQGEINYMQSFMKKFIQELSNGTNLLVEDLNEQLFNEKHQNVNLEKFRKKLLHEIIYERLYNQASEVKKLKEYAKLSQRKFKDNKIESCESINEVLLALDQYHNLVDTNIQGNEEIFPKVKKDTLDQNYLRFLKSQFAFL